MKHRITLSTFFFAVLTAVLALAACDSSGPDLPDPHFEGTFIMEDFQFRVIHITPKVVEDTVLTVSSNPDLTFKSVEDNPNTMRVDFGKFTDDVQLEAFRELFGPDASVVSNFPRQPRVIIDGDEFELANTQFNSEVTYTVIDFQDTDTLNWERFSGKGQLKEDVLVFEFSMFTQEGESSFELSGVATGIRQPF